MAVSKQETAIFLYPYGENALIYNLSYLSNSNYRMDWFIFMG